MDPQGQEEEEEVMVDMEPLDRLVLLFPPGVQGVSVIVIVAALDKPVGEKLGDKTSWGAVREDGKAAVIKYDIVVRTEHLFLALYTLFLLVLRLCLR